MNEQSFNADKLIVYSKKVNRLSFRLNEEKQHSGVSKIIMKADSSTARNFIDLKLNKRKETHEPRGVREGGKSKGQRPR